MELYFTCPKKQIVFKTSDYSLRDGYQVVAADSGGKKLVGEVSLNSACPLCGEYHNYRAEEVLCTYG